MGDALGQQAAGEPIQQPVDHGFVAAAPIERLLDQASPSGPVFLRRQHEGIVAAAGVMEVRNGIREAGEGQVGQKVLETAEGFGGFLGEGGAVDVAVGFGSFHVKIGAPMVAIGVLMPPAAIAARDEGQHPAVDIGGPGLVQLVRDMRGHPVDVFHHEVGAGENGVVDALEDVAHRRAGLIDPDLVGVIDMAVTAGRMTDVVTRHPEFSGQTGDVVTGTVGHKGDVCHDSLASLINPILPHSGADFEPIQAIETQ